MSIFTENYRLCVKLLGDRLAVSGKGVCNIVLSFDRKRNIAYRRFVLGEGVTAMVENISTQVPAIMDIAGNLISTLITVIRDNLPMLVESGLSMLVSLIGGIRDNIYSSCIGNIVHFISKLKLK